MKDHARVHHVRAHRSEMQTLVSSAYPYLAVLTPLFLLGFVVAVLYALGETFEGGREGSFGIVAAGLFISFVRLFISYLISVVLAIPLALFVDRSPTATKVLLPLYDILQSIPYLAFLPVIVLSFVQLGLTQGVAILVLTLGIMWSLVFSIITGLRVIPAEIKYAGQVFGARGLKFFSYVTLPAIVPYLISGSLLSWGEGWNLMIVAEVVHTYIPHGTPAQDIFGIGSVLVNSETSGQTALFMYALVGIIAVVVFINFVVWQHLLSYAERFRFE